MFNGNYGGLPGHPGNPGKHGHPPGHQGNLHPGHVRHHGHAVQGPANLPVHPTHQPLKKQLSAKEYNC